MTFYDTPQQSTEKLAREVTVTAKSTSVIDISSIFGIMFLSSAFGALKSHDEHYANVGAHVEQKLQQAH